jgi:flagellar biosynthetic protein FliO
MFCVLALIAAKIEMVPATSESTIDFTWLFIKMLFVLGAVTILAIFILKYGVPRTAFYKRMTKGSLFRTITRQNIEPRKAIYLVEVGNKHMLLGVTDHAITPILELSADEVAKLEGGKRK